jgi:hypothetical protein
MTMHVLLKAVELLAAQLSAMPLPMPPSRAPERGIRVVGSSCGAQTRLHLWLNSVFLDYRYTWLCTAVPDTSVTFAQLYGMKAGV